MLFGNGNNERLRDLPSGPATISPLQTIGTDDEVRTLVEHEFLLMEEEHARIRANALAHPAGQSNLKTIADGRFK